VRWISNRSNARTWWSLIVNKRNGVLKNLLSAIPLLAITLSALIIMATTVAATTSLSWSLLLNNNNNIKLAKKNISSNEPNVSHKFGNGGLGRAAAGNNNNNIKSINDASTKKLKAG
jgi:hypothetical protein